MNYQSQNKRWISLACAEGFYGKSCVDKCGHCLNGEPCDKRNGTCMKGCQPHFRYPLCKGNYMTIIQTFSAYLKSKRSDWWMLFVLNTRSNIDNLCLSEKLFWSCKQDLSFRARENYLREIKKIQLLFPIRVLEHSDLCSRRIKSNKRSNVHHK